MKSIGAAAIVFLLGLGAAVSSGATPEKAERGGWRREEIPSADVKALAFHPLERGLLLAGTNAGEVYRSEDGGRSWRLAGIDLPFPGGVVNRIIADPRIPRRFYAATWNLWTKGGAPLPPRTPARPGAGFPACPTPSSGRLRRLPARPTWSSSEGRRESGSPRTPESISSG